MNIEQKCPECGTALASGSSEGLCLKCLLQVGGDLNDDFQEESTSETGIEPGWDSLGKRMTAFHQFGDYELLEEIARGGMGVVYRARQLSLNRIVAVKLMLGGPLAEKNFIQRFRTEAAAAASLQHPNIVAIHEVGFARGQHFFAMDYVEGLTLAQLAAKGPLQARIAAGYLKTIAEAIHFAHERNILHRDLKPSNVLIDSATNQPRVTDFGLAKRLETDADLTLTGQVLGSPNYMPPEQLMAKRGLAGRRSDVYSLGAILYHALSGRPPFQGPTLADVLHQVANEEPVAPRLLAPGIPRDLETVCLKCLEKEPSRRYQTAQELAADLNRFLRDEPITARPAGQVEKAWRWCRRKPALASLGAALVLVFSIGFAATLWQWRNAVANQERLDQNLYDSNMSLAQHNWDDGDLGRTLSLLEAHRPRPGEKDRRGFEWYYFRKLCEGDPHVTLAGHKQAVDCVTFSPDGKFLATGSAGDGVRVWDRATGTVLQTLPEESVVSLAFTPDSKGLGVGGRDKVVIWNLQTREEIFRYEENLGQFRIGFPSIEKLMVMGKLAVPPRHEGGSTELWDYGTRKKKRVFPDTGGGYVVLSSRGDTLATGSGYWNEMVTIWNFATESPIARIKARGVTAMALSPDNQILVTSDSSHLSLWDASTGRAIRTLSNLQNDVASLAFSPDGTSLATGGDQRVGLWNTRDWHQTLQFIGHANQVTGVSFSPDSHMIASGSKDKTAMLWSIDASRLETAVSKITSRSIFSPDSQLVAAGVKGHSVAVWEVGTFKTKALFDDATDPVGFSADSRSLLTRGTNYFLRRFDLETQAVLETISQGPVYERESHALLSPDERMLVIGSGHGTLIFCEARTGKVISNIPGAFAGNIFYLAFSPNGKFLAVAGRELEAGRPSTAKIWDTASRKLVKVLTGHTGVVLSVGFSPDGHTLATCGADTTIRFWDVATWKESSPFIAQKDVVRSLAYSPDGKTLASASMGDMKLWNPVTRRELASIKANVPAQSLLFSADGQTLSAANPDDQLRLFRGPISLDMKRSRMPGD